jgi:hypothetical protein
MVIEECRGYCVYNSAYRAEQLVTPVIVLDQDIFHDVKWRHCIVTAVGDDYVQSVFLEGNVIT